MTTLVIVNLCGYGNYFRTEKLLDQDHAVNDQRNLVVPAYSLLSKKISFAVSAVADTCFSVVYVMLSHYAAQPEVQIRLSRRYVFPGDTVNLTCLSSGILKPSLHWSLNGKKVSLRKGFSIERDKLVIRNITIGLQGNYYCAASGTDGGVAANGIEVYLSGVGINAPTFDETETIMRTVFEGENVEFTCEPRLDTTEGLNISWSRTDALPLPEGHIVTAEFSLMLLNVMAADEATYRCTAVNVLGTAFLDYQLEVESM